MKILILHNIKASGNYWPASEKPPGWHFTGGPFMAHNGMLAGYVSLDAYIEQGEQQRLRRKCAYMQSRQMRCCSLTHSSDSTSGWWLVNFRYFCINFLTHYRSGKSLGLIWIGTVWLVKNLSRTALVCTLWTRYRFDKTLCLIWIQFVWAILIRRVFFIIWTFWTQNKSDWTRGYKTFPCSNQQELI